MSVQFLQTGVAVIKVFFSKLQDLIAGKDHLVINDWSVIKLLVSSLGLLMHYQ